MNCRWWFYRNFLTFILFSFVMKRMHSIVVYLCLWFSFFLGTSTFALTPKDISSHQYRESIQYLYDHGVVQWYADNTFGPDRDITRA